MYAHQRSACLGGRLSARVPPASSVVPQRTVRSGRAAAVAVRAQSDVPPTATKPNYGNLTVAYDDYAKVPPSMKFEFSKGILEEMQALKSAGGVPKWGSAAENLTRRNVFQGELKQVGIKQPGTIAVPSVRNDAAFLATVVLSASVVAVAALAILPGEWGFFTSYLVGGIIIAVMGIGSTAPGLLQVIIDKFSQVFPDYKERVIRHEAAHFLVGYLMGVPVTGYDLGIGKEHTEFAEVKTQKRLIEGRLEDDEINALSVVAVAGISAEGQVYEEVMGQTADLVDLQRILLRAVNKLNDNSQQNMTRWAVFVASSLLRRYKKEHEAVMEGMSRGAPVIELVKAIEGA